MLIASEQILHLFPLGAISPQPAEEAPNMDEDTARLKDVQRSLLWQKPQPVGEDGEPENIRRPGELYQRYRTEEQLPEHAKVFFGLAGKSILSPRARQTLTREKPRMLEYP